MTKEIQPEYLREQIDRLLRENKLLKDGLLTPAERVMLSFFENMTPNIAAWASRGSDQDFEIVFWNKGAETIYGYSEDEALGKSCADLFMCDEQRDDAKSDCDKIIDGASFQNMIATDINKDGAQIIVITNTFRIDDFERKGEYLQAEIGVDVSDLEELHPFRSLNEVNYKLSLLESLMTCLGKLVGSATKAPDLRGLLDSIPNIAQELFPEKLTILVAGRPSVKYPTLTAFCLPSAKGPECDDLFGLLDRMGAKRSYFESSSITIPFIPLGSNLRIGFAHLRFHDGRKLSETERWILSVLAEQIMFAFQFVVKKVYH